MVFPRVLALDHILVLQQNHLKKVKRQLFKTKEVCNIGCKISTRGLSSDIGMKNNGIRKFLSSLQVKSNNIRPTYEKGKDRFGFQSSQS